MSIKGLSISKKIKDRLLFQDLNFEFRHRELSIVTGPVGVGKSTLLKIITGLYSVDQGQVDRDSSLKFSLCMDRSGLDLDLNVEQNLYPWSYSKDHADRQIERWGFNTLRKMKVYQLSAGQQKKVMLARCFSQSSHYYILDEPTLSLATSDLACLLDCIRETLQSSGVIIATHQMEYFKEFEQVKEVILT